MSEKKYKKNIVDKDQIRSYKSLLNLNYAPDNEIERVINRHSSFLIFRNRLISIMLRDRYVPRLLCAPKGFGKSFLSLTYASRFFRKEEYLYIDANDSAFINQIDKIKTPFDFISKEIKLVILDDLPSLNVERSSKINDFISSLAFKNVELIASCLPSNRNFYDFSPETILITAKDLLLDDNELAFINSAKTEQNNTIDLEACDIKISSQDVYKAQSHILRDNFVNNSRDNRFEMNNFVDLESSNKIQRIGNGNSNNSVKYNNFDCASNESFLSNVPVVVFSNNNYSPYDCLRNIFTESLDHNFVKVLISMLLLGQGNFKELQSLDINIDENCYSMLQNYYPIVKINSLDYQFKSELSNLSMLKNSLLNFDISKAVNEGQFSLIQKCIALLLKKSNYTRAYELLENFCTDEYCALWLCEYGLELVDKGELELVKSLLNRVPDTMHFMYPEIITIKAIYSLYTGKQFDAILHCKQILNTYEQFESDTYSKNFAVLFSLMILIIFNEIDKANTYLKEIDKTTLNTNFNAIYLLLLNLDSVAFQSCFNEFINMTNDTKVKKLSKSKIDLLESATEDFVEINTNSFTDNVILHILFSLNIPSVTEICIANAEKLLLYF
ncbi:MAG: hypothetical protein MJ189_00620 [Coriobacteriales bacterium]|nr:hypothetical protein [Coriobacteriales bacterium]